MSTALRSSRLASVHLSYYLWYLVPIQILLILGWLAVVHVQNVYPDIILEHQKWHYICASVMTLHHDDDQILWLKNLI